MLVIHGRATSSNVQPVVWLAAILGLDFERRDVGGAFGGTDTQEYREINPMGKIPAIEDEHVRMFESQAILRYLAARHEAETLWPRDEKSRACIDQWMEWSKTAVSPLVVYKVFWQLIRTPENVRDNKGLAAAVEELKGVMAIAEAQIARHGWLAADRMTLADVSFAVNLYRYFTLPFQRADLPALRGYYERLADDHLYREHVMVDYEPLRAPGA